MPSLATTPTPRDFRIGWSDTHSDHSKVAKSSKAKVVILGDSIAYGLTRYPEVWYRYFAKKSLNLGIPGDHTQNVLWRLANISLPDTLDYAIVVVGTNNLGHDSNKNIAEAILLVADLVLKKHPKIKVIISGLLPRDNSTSRKRKDIK